MRSFAVVNCLSIYIFNFIFCLSFLWSAGSLVGYKLLDHNCPPISVKLAGNRVFGRRSKFKTTARSAEYLEIYGFIFMEFSVQRVNILRKKCVNFVEDQCVCNSSGMWSMYFRKLWMEFDEIVC